jgi:thiol-disulfide isomerase/thioredoxin
MPRLPAAVALGLALAACSSSNASTSTEVVRFQIGERRAAPAIEGEALLDTLTVEQITSGKPAIVNFWGSWCGPCRTEEPILEEAHRAFGDAVTFIGVDTRHDQRAAALAFLEEFDVTYGSVYDPDSRIATAYGVRIMPATFIIDPDGDIAAQIIGAVRSVEQLDALIDEVTA